MFVGKGLESSNGSADASDRFPRRFEGDFGLPRWPARAPVAWLSTRSGCNLRFAAGLVVLTDRRLMSFRAGRAMVHSGERMFRPGRWRTRLRCRSKSMRAGDAGAVSDGDSRLARWRYTAAACGGGASVSAAVCDARRGAGRGRRREQDDRLPKLRGGARRRRRGVSGLQAGSGRAVAVRAAAAGSICRAVDAGHLAGVRADTGLRTARAWFRSI